MALEDVTAATLAALHRVHEGLYRALVDSFDDVEFEPYTAEDEARDAWADSHPMAQPEFKEAS